MVFYQVWKPVQDPDDIQAFLTTQMGDPFQSVLVAHSDGCVIVQTAEDIPSQVTLERIVSLLQLYPREDGETVAPSEPAAEEWSVDVFGTDNTSLGRVLVGPGLHVGDSVIQVQKDLELTRMTFTGTDGGSVSLSGPTDGETYDLTLPKGLPASGKQYVTVGTSGEMSFEAGTSTGPLSAIHNAGGIVSDCKLWCGTVTSSGGEVTVHPTDDGTVAGTPVFTASILHVTGTVIQEQSGGEAKYSVTLRSVSADRKAVVLNLFGDGPIDGVQVLIFGV